MKIKSIKNNIMIVTTVIFFVMTLFFNIDLYQIKRNEIERRSTQTYQNLQNIVATIQNNIKTTLSSRLETISKIDFFTSIKQDLKTNTSTHREAVYPKLQFHFEHIQKQITTLSTLHIIDKDGYSYIRVHDKGLHSDKIASQRISIASSLKAPQLRAFYEDGLYGVHYRVSLPLFDGEEFIGLLESGVAPEILLYKLEALLGHKSYLLHKQEETKNFYAQSSLDRDLAAVLVSPDKKINFQEKTYIKHEHPIYDFSNNIVLKVVTLEDITTLEQDFQSSLIHSFLVSLVLMFVLLALLERLLLKILKRIDELLFMLNKTDDYIFAIDASTQKIKFANAALYKALAISKKDLKEKNIASLLLPRYEEDSGFNELFYGKEEKTQSKEAILICSQNKEIPLEVRINYVNKDGGYYIALCRDISEHLQQKLQKQVNEKMINKYIPLSHTDLQGNITYANAAFCRLTGYTQEELLGQNHRILRSPKTSKEFYSKLWKNITSNNSFSGELRVVTKTKEEIWVRIVIEPRFDINGKKIGYVSTREDVTDKQELRFISEHDQLTKIYNRRSFESKLLQLLDTNKKEQLSFGLLMFDIDHFKNVNDTYGHQVGDDILQAISRHIKEVIREDDFFARWGGEEFMLLLKTSKLEELEVVIAKIQKRLQTADYTPVPSITLSFGLTIAKQDDTQESILKRADTALYEAKAKGRNRYEVVL